MPYELYSLRSFRPRCIRGPGHLRPQCACITLGVDMYLVPITTRTTNVGSNRTQELRAGQPVHGPRHPAAEPRGLCRWGDVLLPPDRRRLARSFRDSGLHWLHWRHTGKGPTLWSGDEAVNVLRFAIATYTSSASGGIGVNPDRSSNSSSVVRLVVSGRREFRDDAYQLDAWLPPAGALWIPSRDGKLLCPA